MKTYQIKESKHPVSSKIYEPSYDVVNISNPTEFWIVEPGEFKLGEILQEGDFHLEQRSYTGGGDMVKGVFAVRTKKKSKFKLLVTIAVEVESDFTALADVVDEFGSDCDYSLPSTDNVKVLNTEWLDTERSF